MRNKTLIPALIMLLSLFIGCANANDELKVDICGIKMVQKEYSDLIFTGPMTFKEADTSYKSQVGSAENKRLKKKWEDFKIKAENSICVYEFTSDEESWKTLSGIQGFALIKDGKAVDMFILTKS